MCLATQKHKTIKYYVHHTSQTNESQEHVGGFSPDFFKWLVFGKHRLTKISDAIFFNKKKIFFNQIIFQTVRLLCSYVTIWIYVCAEQQGEDSDTDPHFWPALSTPVLMQHLFPLHRLQQQNLGKTLCTLDKLPTLPTGTGQSPKISRQAIPVKNLKRLGNNKLIYVLLFQEQLRNILRFYIKTEKQMVSSCFLTRHWGNHFSFRFKRDEIIEQS